MSRLSAGFTMQFINVMHVGRCDILQCIGEVLGGSTSCS